MERIEVYNVVRIKDGVVFDEILSTRCFDEAEKKFVDDAKLLGYEAEDDDNYILDEGYYKSKNTNESVCLTTSFLTL